MWVVPVQGEIIGGFGWRSGDGGGDEQFSSGVLMAASADGAVKAAGAGTVTGVTLAPDDRGIAVEINHGGGWTTRYSGLARAVVEAGQEVSAGQTIATLDPDGEGLHFEMMRQGIRVDPEPKLRRSGS